jgi:hypothetical protein
VSENLASSPLVLWMAVFLLCPPMGIPPWTCAFNVHVCISKFPFHKDSGQIELEPTLTF